MKFPAVGNREFFPCYREFLDIGRERIVKRPSHEALSRVSNSNREFG
jgi:hypothetical protein